MRITLTQHNGQRINSETSAPSHMIAYEADNRDLLAGLPCKNSKSKGIKKEKHCPQTLSKIIRSGFDSEKRLVLFSKPKSRATRYTNDNQHDEEPSVARSYLKGSKLEYTLSKLRAKCIAVQRRVAPTDFDFAEKKISFQD
jgi:hypothetical protein